MKLEIRPAKREDIFNLQIYYIFAKAPIIMTTGVHLMNIKGILV